MRITTKVQVTIPRNVRRKLSITPDTEIDFKEENGKFYIVVKTNKPSTTTGEFKKLRGIATAKMSTDGIMSLTREPS